MPIRVLTAGESHGKSLSVIIDGLPAGIPITQEDVDFQLRRRQCGYGRGGRMQIEKDSGEVISGIRFGLTTGAPVSILIKNRDWENWQEKLSIFGNRGTTERVTIPRPGHADMTGIQKYLFDDIRPSIERSSARETAARVAAGSVAMAFLRIFGIQIDSYVESIGDVTAKVKLYHRLCEKKINESRFSDIISYSESSVVKTTDAEAEKKIIERIKHAKKNGDTLGGTFVTVVRGVQAGLGSFSQFDRRLDAALAASIMGINAVKAVEFGLGFKSSESLGSRAHDPIIAKGGKICRSTNRSGGIEGGISNGEWILIRSAMKPIATLMNPLPSIDLSSMQPVESRRERSDFTAVPACAVISESVAAITLASFFLEKFGGDSITEIQSRYNGYYENLQEYIRKNFVTP